MARNFWASEAGIQRYSVGESWVGAEVDGGVVEGLQALTMMRAARGMKMRESGCMGVSGCVVATGERYLLEFVVGDRLVCPGVAGAVGVLLAGDVEFSGVARAAEFEVSEGA